MCVTLVCFSSNTVSELAAALGQSSLAGQRILWTTFNVDRYNNSVYTELVRL